MRQGLTVILRREIFGGTSTFLTVRFRGRSLDIAYDRPTKRRDIQFHLRRDFGNTQT